MSAKLDILIGARNMLADPKRWHKGEYASPLGSYCILGACCYAENPTLSWNEVDEPTNSVGEVLEAALPEGVEDRARQQGMCAIPFFNDYVATHAEVIALFDRAIADERARIAEQEAGAPLPAVEEPVRA